MIDEPVVNLSESRTSPTSGEVQITISSAKRDRCTDAIAAGRRLGDPVALIVLKDDEWTTAMRGFSPVPFHFGGAQLLLASLIAE